MHKYERRCWFCGSKNIEPDGRGIRCRDCGATWNKLPQSHGCDMTLEYDYALSDKHMNNKRSASPSRTVQRRAVKARGDTKNEASPEVPPEHI